MRKLNGREEEMKWERGRDEKREGANGMEERGVEMEGKF